MTFCLEEVENIIVCFFLLFLDVFYSLLKIKNYSRAQFTGIGIRDIFFLSTVLGTLSQNRSTVSVLGTMSLITTVSVLGTLS